MYKATKKQQMRVVLKVTASRSYEIETIVQICPSGLEYGEYLFSECGVVYGIHRMVMNIAQQEVQGKKAASNAQDSEEAPP